jgi:hypothetical protein
VNPRTIFYRPLPKKDTGIIGLSIDMTPVSLYIRQTSLRKAENCPFGKQFSDYPGRAKIRQ